MLRKTALKIYNLKIQRPFNIQQQAVFVKHHFPRKQQILDSSKLKELRTTISKFVEDGRKFPRGVENTVGKGEIARYEQFLLFPQCFQKTNNVLQIHESQNLFGKGLNASEHISGQQD